MSKVQVHVDGLEDMGKRFVSAWKRAEAGERVDEQHHLFQPRSIAGNPIPQATGFT
ncbi:MAG: hypothetical protein ACREYF_06105 [Gammaproteobacteria bacterium]